MIKKILPLLNKFIPESVAIKGLTKVNPKFGEFISKATAAGYATNEALGFIRNQLGPIEGQGLRADELAGLTRIKQSQAPEQFGKAALRTGIGATTAGLVPTVLSSMFEGQGEQKEAGMQEDVKSKYPDFFRFIDGEIKQGRNPAEAAAVANVQGYSKTISDIQKETGMNIEDYLASLYGQNQQAGQQQQSPQSQQGNIDQALMDALQKILSM